MENEEFQVKPDKALATLEKELNSKRATLTAEFDKVKAVAISAEIVNLEGQLTATRAKLTAELNN